MAYETKEPRTQEAGSPDGLLDRGQPSQATGPVGGHLPGHVNPEIGLGDLINYSGLLGQLITAFVSLKGSAVGATAKLPPFETWLPVGGEWEIDIIAKRLR